MGQDEATFETAVEVAFRWGDDVTLNRTRCSTDRRFQPKDILHHAGQSGAQVFLVLAGRAQARAFGLTGRVVVVSEFAGGDIFGAFEPAEVFPDDADVIAVDSTRAAVVPGRAFVALAERHGAIAQALVRSLLRQLRSASARMADGVTLSAPGRVHAELIRLARLKDGKTIEPIPVLSVLATRLNTTRETVSRTISALERRGIVRREQGYLIIVAVQRLEDLII
jgi:CRP/FNR family cyclic AMP-dependent transcriptional regulator